MPSGITREKALELIDKYIKNENMKKHLNEFAQLAVEAMREISDDLGL